MVSGRRIQLSLDHLLHMAAVMRIRTTPKSSINGSMVNWLASLYTAAKSSRTLPAMRGYRS